MHHNNFSSAQLVPATVFIVLYLPCVASLFTLIKEIGIKTAVKIVVVVFIMAFISAVILNPFYFRYQQKAYESKFYQEISKILDYPISAVKSFLFRTHQTLRDRLKDVVK